jgi:hypothetical protein
LVFLGRRASALRPEGPSWPRGRRGFSQLRSGPRYKYLRHTGGRKTTTYTNGLETKRPSNLSLHRGPPSNLRGAVIPKRNQRNVDPRTPAESRPQRCRVCLSGPQTSTPLALHCEGRETDVIGSVWLYLQGFQAGLGLLQVCLGCALGRRPRANPRQTQSKPLRVEPKRPDNVHVAPLAPPPLRRSRASSDTFWPGLGPESQGERTKNKSKPARAEGPGTLGPVCGPLTLAFGPKLTLHRPKIGPWPSKGLGCLSRR